MYNLGKTAYEAYYNEDRKKEDKLDPLEWNLLSEFTQKLWNNVALEVIKQYIKDCPI